MSEESKNTEIVRLHLTDIYKADPGKVPTASELIAEITKVASENFKDKKIKIRIKLLDSYCPYFRIPKDTKFNVEPGLNMEGDYLVFEPTEAVASSAEAAASSAEAAKEPVAALATTPNQGEAAAQTNLDTSIAEEAAAAENRKEVEGIMKNADKSYAGFKQQQEARGAKAKADIERRKRERNKKRRNKKGEIYVVVEGEAPDNDDELEYDMNDNTDDESLANEFRLDLPNHWANIKNLFKATDAFQTMADKANQERIFNEIIEASINKWYNNDVPAGIDLTEEQKEELKKELKKEILERTNMNEKNYNEIEEGLAEYFNKTSFEKRGGK